MKADSLKIAKVFSSGGDVQYFLPYFQREYAWEKENWQTLLNDVLGLYVVFTNEQLPEHFMGSLVVINDGAQNGTVPIFKLVDGQQRLTTISLILSALASIIKDTNLGLYKKIRKLITNPDEENLLHYKLLPTTKYGDRQAYLSIIDEDKVIQSESKIPNAYQYFKNEIANKIDGGKIEPERFFLVLTNCLQVVFIDLNKDERPYEIFESLNAKGKPLTQADLVRNYIAMKLPENRQPEIFDKYWSKIENLLKENRTVGRSRLGELTAFLRHYLSFKSGTLCNEEHVYERFRDRIEREFDSPSEFENEIKNLLRFAEFYDRLLRPDNEAELEIREYLNHLNIFEFSTGYPFLLTVYDSYDKKLILRTQFVECLQVLENFIVRRYIVGEPTNYLNKIFPSLWKEIDNNRYVESLKVALAQRNYPSDHQLEQAFLTEGLYDNSSLTRAKTVFILETINRRISIDKNSGAYTLLDGSPTVEHIMPQKLSDIWKETLGQGWEQIYHDYLHTLGNLTLVTTDWNSELNNRSFVFKKQKLATHGLVINNEWFTKSIENWNEDAIRLRANFLGQLFLSIWPKIGETPRPKSSETTKPIRVILLDEPITVSSWRDVASQTTEMVIKLSNNFDDIAEKMPAYLDKRRFPNADRQLSNGWYLNTNLSSRAIKTYCRNLIVNAGLSDEDWSVEVE